MFEKAIALDPHMPRRTRSWVDLLHGVGLALECGSPDSGAGVGAGATGRRPG